MDARECMGKQRRKEERKKRIKKKKYNETHRWVRMGKVGMGMGIGVHHIGYTLCRMVTSHRLYTLHCTQTDTHVANKHTSNQQKKKKAQKQMTRRMD